MLKTFKHIILLIVCSSCLASCGFLGRHEDMYQKSHSIAPMRVPSGLSSNSIDEHYPVPPAKKFHHTGKVDLLPPGVSRS